MPTRWFLLFLAFHAVAQDSSEDAEFKIRADVELVLLDVSVQNLSGGYVTGLVKDQFQIFENGVPQKITDFAVADTPVAVGLVMDDSGSMEFRRSPVIAAGLAFVEASNPSDQVFVVNFNDKARLGLPVSSPFTDDVNLPLGRLRARASGSEGGHNGLRSIIQNTGDAFLRIRCGVDKPGGGKEKVTGHVLGGFSKAEQTELPFLIGGAADAVELIMKQGATIAMNRVNAEKQ